MMCYASDDAGQAYYLQCKQALEGLQIAECAIDQSKRQATGVLSIMATRYFSCAQLFPRLAEFMRQNPLLRIRLHLAERFPDFDKEGIDILFGASMEGDANLVKHHYITHSGRHPDNVIFLKKVNRCRSILSCG
jgi:DNA-binding transcriptional LysR family regulator